MRFLRLIFIVALAIILIAVALANRDIVTLSAFPANFGQYLGGRWSVDLPLFLVIFLAFALGMLAGLVWEWLRESHIRRELRAKAARAARLENEVGHLRERHASPKDEVLAILDRPKPAAAPATPVASAEPASGTTLPANR
ncbi:lipopolysaccharide assembly protein LapA domain-containing protein [Paracoccus benzoatiresistens]|uniref:Lipopolysaccharide assembly protein LapA domain-containing protein n=1 Tax=Paracoccus benzoatiresistens TaxID=2997341 RepID=A0ABT4J5E5_9RHOB|nr:lipopolysaccharide assembly protein LapA domain-containing protein [Paracoccus sp. EF6]MCZ0961661.1 lipopolysaccharide assembly protein LapA domain-containing protein [Paracoccus sp. EF6]